MTAGPGMLVLIDGSLARLKVKRNRLLAVTQRLLRRQHQHDTLFDSKRQPRSHCEHAQHTSVCTSRYALTLYRNIRSTPPMPARLAMLPRLALKRLLRTMKKQIIPITLFGRGLRLYAALPIPIDTTTNTTRGSPFIRRSFTSSISASRCSKWCHSTPSIPIFNARTPS